MSSSPNATSTHVPAGPGPSDSGVADVCTRHPYVDGPHLCKTCDQPLCTACAHHPRHAQCPTCARSNGLEVFDLRWAWLWRLTVDAGAKALPTLHRTALPLIALLLSVLEGLGQRDPSFWIGSTMGSFGDVALTALLLGSMATGMRGVPGAGERVRRALAIMFVGGVLMSIPAVLLMVPFSGVAIHGGDGPDLFYALRQLLVMLPWLLVGACLTVSQAASALRGLGVMDSVKVPFRSGLRAWCMVAASCVLTQSLWMPLRWFGYGGGMGTVLVHALLACVRIFVQAALAVGCLRFLLDARAARGKS